MPKKIPQVKSLFDLRTKAESDPRYLELAKSAARNFGGSDRQCETLSAAMQWLDTNAMETDERGVVAEVNALR